MYTNKTDIPIALAVMLATDTYDYDPTPNLISATSLLKPLKSLVLSKRIEPRSIDLLDIYKSRIGTAVHDSLEQAWKSPNKALYLLKYAPEVIHGLKNKVHSEIRSKKQIGKYIVSGKFDICINGQVQDLKTTSTYSYVKSSNDEAYIKQLSIYKWLNPDIITDDYGKILYMFTDWKQFQTSQVGYPKYPVMHKDLLLDPNIEIWLSERLSLYDSLLDSTDLPDCTDKELLRDASKWQYFSNPEKLNRATKNFTNLSDANIHLMTQNKGIVIEKKGKPVYCKWCPAQLACTQAEKYIESGELEL